MGGRRFTILDLLIQVCSYTLLTLLWGYWITSCYQNPVQ
jgi:hypothetical protein